MITKQDVTLSIPGLERVTITNGFVHELEIPTIFHKQFDKFATPLKSNDLVTTLAIHVTRRSLRTKINLGGIISTLDMLTRNILQEQTCTLCDKQNVTIQKLLPLPKKDESIPISLILHLLIHLILKQLLWIRQEFYKKGVEERVGWSTKSKKILFVLFTCPLDQNKIASRLEAAYDEFLKPLINEGGATK